MQGEREYLQFVHGYYADSVKNSDQKALVILTLAIGVFLFLGARSESMGPMVGAVIGSLKDGAIDPVLKLQAVDKVRAALWMVAMISSLIAQVSGLRTLQPRSRTSSDDEIFWENVARTSQSDFVQRTQRALSSDNNAGIYSNIYNLAHILRSKFRNAGNATNWALLMIYCVALFTILPPAG